VIFVLRILLSLNAQLVLPAVVAALEKVSVPKHVFSDVQRLVVPLPCLTMVQPPPHQIKFANFAHSTPLLNVLAENPAVDAEPAKVYVLTSVHLDVLHQLAVPNLQDQRFASSENAIVAFTKKSQISVEAAYVAPPVVMALHLELAH